VITIVLQVGKKGEVVRSPIRAVRRLVKKIPVKILQKYSITRICMQMHLPRRSTTPGVLLLVVYLA
jgi:hypothetical protein